jgi:hypothetical protein
MRKLLMFMLMLASPLLTSMLGVQQTCLTLLLANNDTLAFLLRLLITLLGAKPDAWPGTMLMLL